MEKNYFNQDTIEWLAQRCGRFTASEIHKLFVGGRKKDELFGQGAMTYIRTKAAELLTMEVKEEVNFKQAEWGKANETDGVRALEEHLGFTGIHYGIVNPEFFNYGDFAGGSPDWESLDQLDGADIKCPYDSGEHVKNLMILSADELQTERWEYYCQGQMNMRIRGWQKFHFVSYDPRMIEPSLRLKVITIYPDGEWLEEFDFRLKEATRLLKSIVGSLQTQPVTA